MKAMCDRELFFDSVVEENKWVQRKGLSTPPSLSYNGIEDLALAKNLKDNGLLDAEMPKVQ